MSLVTVFSSLDRRGARQQKPVTSLRDNFQPQGAGNSREKLSIPNDLIVSIFEQAVIQRILEITETLYTACQTIPKPPNLSSFIHAYTSLAAFVTFAPELPSSIAMISSTHT
jgi:hypothetical protein